MSSSTASTLSFWFLSLACGTLLVAPLSAADAPVDLDGRPLKDAAGERVNYASAPVRAAFSERAGVQETAGAQATTAGAPADPFGEATKPFWQYSIFGTSIGASGIRFAQVAGKTEIYLGGSAAGDFWGNDFWQALRFNAATGNYETVFVSESFSSQLMSLVRGDVAAGNAGIEIVAALEDGTVIVYDGTTKAEIKRLSTVADLAALKLADLDGDGGLELLIVTANDFRVHDRDGTLLWRLANAGGRDLVAAQMDGDAGLEVATTSGKVIDVTSRTVQWNRTGGFGAYLEVVDMDGDGRDELIAADPWYWVYAYDVDTQLPKWSIRTDLDIGAIALGNVDADALPELLIGDGQWGEVHVYELTTQQQQWQIANPEHGVTQIAVRDVDDDGTLEILWGAGASSTGEDHLYVASVATKQIEWQNIHLDGPFVGPVIGDIDGDGVPELVACSSDSNAGYDSGCLVVFDAATRAVRAISEPLFENRAWTGVRDLKLRDVNGDGRLEILVSAAWLYDGMIEIYRFTPANTFNRLWTNATRPEGAAFTAVDLLDIDGNGSKEVVAVNSSEHTGSEGTFIYVYDYATGAEVWRSLNLQGAFWDGVKQMAIADFDQDGHPEIAALLSGVGVYIFDLTTKAIEQILSGPYTAIAENPGVGFLLGDSSGNITPWAFADGSYNAGAAWSAGTLPIEGITRRGATESWVSAGGALSYWIAPANLAWRSEAFSYFGPRVIFNDEADALEVFGATRGTVAAFHPAEATALPLVALSVSGALEEGGADDGKFTITRSVVVDSAIDVHIGIEGTATEGNDYEVLGATPVAGAPGEWVVSLAAGELSAKVRFRPIDDRLAEGRETIVATILAHADYVAGAAASATLALDDNESIVSVVTSDGNASEARRLDRREDIGVFTLNRSGSLARPLAAFFRLGGTADNGADYRALGGVAVFNPGRSEAKVRIIPRQDRLAEPAEQVTIELLPSARYLVASDAGAASLLIADDEPTVGLVSSEVGLEDGAPFARVLLSRGKGAARPLRFSVLLTRRVVGGEEEVEVLTARFSEGEASIVVSIPSRADGGMGDEHVAVALVEHPAYHLDANSKLEFDIPPPSP